MFSLFDVNATPAAVLGDIVSDADPSVTATNTLDQSNEMPLDSNDAIPVGSADPMFDVFQKRGIHVVHLNIQSLLSKLDELRCIAINSKATIICITETWLDESICDPEISIPEYDLLRNDRNRDGGGVCVCISEVTLRTERERIDLQHPDLETVWAEVLLPKTRPILVGTCYRTPKQMTFNFRSNIFKTISSTERIVRSFEHK